MSEQTGALDEPFEFDVFLSYRHREKDGDFARWLYRSLTAAGFRVAIDEVSFIGGRPVVAEQARCAEGSRRTLAVVSARYLESGFCEAEGLTALFLGMKHRQTRLVPVAIEPTHGLGVPLWLDGLAPIPWYDTDALRSPWDRLMDALTAPDQPRPVAPATPWAPPTPGGLNAAASGSGNIIIQATEGSRVEFWGAGSGE